MPSTQNGEFMPKDNDFQLFEVVRAKTQGSELDKPTEHQVAERDKHEPSCVAHSTHGLLSASGSEEPGIRINAPYTHQKGVPGRR